MLAGLLLLALLGGIGYVAFVALRPRVPLVGVVATVSAPATSTVTAPVAKRLASALATDYVAAYALPYPNPPAVKPVVIDRLHPKHDYISFTIDDGIPFDVRMIELFERYHVRGTAFLLGQAVKAHPDLVKRLKADGWEIANHTWDHKGLRKMSESGVRDELARTQAAISAITGNQAPYMRPPGGTYSSKTVTIAASVGYRTVLWGRSLADTSASATPQQLYINATKGLQPGELLLCHWGRPDTYDAMKLILPELERRGITSVTLSQLIADSGGIEALK